MSDLMLRGVILMPYDMAMRDELSRRQFHSRAQALLADYDRMRKAAKELADWVEYEVGASREESPGLAEIRAALAQEQGGSDVDR